MDAASRIPTPRNEPVLDYAPGSSERRELSSQLVELAATRTELTCTIGGQQRMGGGEPGEVVQPHRHAEVLGTFGNATSQDARDAVAAAAVAAPAWRAMSYADRAAVFLRAADLLAGPWRA